MKFRKLAIAATAASALSVFAVASPAMAASTECTALPVNPTCTTGVIAANASGHFIDYYIYSTLLTVQTKNWSIKDLDTGRVVKSGAFNLALQDTGRVNGLYGRRYQLTLRCGCWLNGAIENQ